MARGRDLRVAQVVTTPQRCPSPRPPSRRGVRGAPGKSLNMHFIRLAGPGNRSSLGQTNLILPSGNGGGAGIRCGPAAPLRGGVGPPHRTPPVPRGSAVAGEARGQRGAPPRPEWPAGTPRPDTTLTTRHARRAEESPSGPTSTRPTSPTPARSPPPPRTSSCGPSGTPPTPSSPLRTGRGSTSASTGTWPGRSWGSTSST